MPTPARVLKLGGSLLQWPGLRDALRAWREANPHALDLMIVGGGKAADWVREADETHQLGDETAHRLAIKAMQLNAELAESVWPEALALTRFDAVLSPTSRAGFWILQPWPTLSDQRQSQYGDVLPHSWNVTSDSIAAWVANAIGACELTLFKSKLPWSHDLENASVEGVVDRHFPQIARSRGRLRIVNLRDGAERELR